MRVEKSDQLASILLKEAGWSEDKKRNALASKKLYRLTFVQMTLYSYYYVTAWVEKRSNTSFTRPFINTMMQQVLAVLIGLL